MAGLVSLVGAMSAFDPGLPTFLKMVDGNGEMQLILWRIQDGGVLVHVADETDEETTKRYFFPWPSVQYVRQNFSTES